MRKILMAAIAAVFLSSPLFTSAAEVGDDVPIVGNGYVQLIYDTAYGAEIYRFYVIRPLIDGEAVRSAYLYACTGPTQEQCELSGFSMVEVNDTVFSSLGDYGLIDTFGVITTISEKLYYETYYMLATADIGF